MKTEFFMLTKQLPHKFCSGLFYKVNDKYYQRHSHGDDEFHNEYDRLVEWRTDGYLDIPMFAWED